MTPKFKTKVINKRLLLTTPLKEYIATLDGDVEVVIKKWRDNRSNNQNSYYHGVVVVLINEEMGDLTKEETHQFLASKFLGKRMVVKGEEYLFVPSTASLNTKDFELYLSQIRQWASMELNCFVPTPNQVDY